MKENIKIVTAGAGSGKTYRLATEVLQAIQQKKSPTGRNSFDDVYPQSCR